MHKKDGSLHFCIDFCKLNARTKKDLSASVGTRSHWEPSWCRILFLLGPEGRVLTDCNGWGIEVIHCFHYGESRTLECKCMAFGLCNAPATFQRLMQKCLGQLNLTHCFIYLDDMIVFSKMEEDHSQCLCIVFNCFREHNLGLKPIKCELFWNEITLWLIMSPRRVCNPAKRT